MKKLYKNLVAVALFALGVSSASAQVNYTQDFTAGLSSWTGGWSTTTTNACAGTAVRKNIYTVGSQGAFTSPLLGTAAGAQHTISFDYKIVQYSTTNAGYTGNFGTIDVQYGATATGPWTTVSTINNVNHVVAGTCANKSFNFTPPAGDVYVRFNCTWNTGDYYTYFDNVSVIVTPSCPKPTALTATGITANSANLSWTEAGSATEWAVQYGASPYTLGTQATVGYTSLAAANASLTSLTPNTGYTYYVRSICAPGDSSTWAGPFSFTTPCASSAFPWTENFDALATTGTTIFPGCWFKQNGDWTTTINSSSTYDADAKSGPNFLRNSYSATNEFMWTPGFDLVAGESYDFSFWWAGDNYSGWTGDVFYNTVQNGTGATQMGTSFVTSGVTTTKTYKEELRRFQAPTTGTYYFAIRVNATGSPWYLSFDDFGLSATPPCPDPSALMTTFVDNDSVAFSWTAGYLESNWNVEVGTTGFTPGTGTAVYTGTSIVAADTATGLTQITDYEIYIQADCGGGDMSAWVGPIAFTSLPNCSAPTNFVANVLAPDSVELTWTGGSTGETDWTIAYGVNPYSPGDAGGSMVSVSTISADTIGNLMQNTTYDFYVLGNCSLTDSSLWVGPETVSTPLFCNNVNTLAATTVVDTAFLSWTAGSNGETMWNVEYGPAGFTLGTGISYSTMNNNTDTLVGLLGSSTYQYYVQAACASGDTSLFTGPFTFSMPLTNDEPCDAIVLPVDGMVRIFTGTGSTAGPTEQVDLAIPGTNCSSNDAWCNSNVNFSTWFTFVAPASGNVIVSSTATTADGQLAMFDVTDCADFTTFDLLAANDDYSGLAPEISACGLTPGNTYYVVYDPWSSSSAIANFAMQITEVSLDAGTNGVATVCSSEGVDLNSIATILDVTGTWSFDLNPNSIVDDTLFNAASVPVGTHVVTYNVSAGCAVDSVTATLTIVAPGQSGTAVSPFTVCNAGDVFLPNGLTGVVESGGTWSDDSGTGLLAGTNGNVFVANGLPVGTYPFTYTVSNGICPNASTSITVTLTNCTSVEENAMEVAVYPNPNNGTFNIVTDVTESVVITVMDVQGKVVYNNKVSLSSGIANEVNVGSVETGLYILKVSSENYISTSTFIIK